MIQVNDQKGKNIMEVINMYDIIIVGAGTAGLSAAIYGVRAGKSVMILEASNYGGQIVNTPEVANYPAIKRISGFEFATNLYEQATELGAVLEYEKVIKIIDKEDSKVVVTDKKEYECKSVILATGAKNRLLGVEREKDLIGAGVSYCATCDGAFFKGKDVAVVGGGNTALEDAAFLANYCHKVYVIHRRDKFRGEEKLLGVLEQKHNVTFILDSKVVKLNGEVKLDSVTIQNIKTEKVEEILIAGLFVAIGQAPENASFADLIEIDKGGYIQASEDCKTKVPGIFTAGDCRTKVVRQLATATADGAVAGLAACEYIG